MPDIILRRYAPADHAAAIALWHACGLHPGQSDTPEGLVRKLERDPDLFILAIDNGAVIGSVMGSYDGRRGWINRLAVAPTHRGQGLADRLMDEVQRRMVAIGCVKVNLLIEPENAGVQAYYERLGFGADPLIFMEKWLGQPAGDTQ